MYRMLKTMHIYITIVGLLVFTMVSAGQSSDPRLYKQSGCMTSGGIWFARDLHIEECVETCIRQAKCLSVNYNRFSTVCILRDTDDEPSSHGYCNHVLLRDLDIAEFLPSDPCNGRPCNKRSMCEPTNNGADFKCTLLYCDHDKLPTIPNTRILSPTPAKINKTNAYMCDAGYTMFGDTRIYCLSDGEWSAVGFQCFKDCPADLQKVTATVKARSTARLTYNTTVTYTCKPAYYTLVQPIITCTIDGTWTDFDCLPYCKQEHIPPIANGEPEYGTLYTINEKAGYHCNTGYYLSADNNKLDCGPDGRWSNPGVECWKYCTTDTGVPANSVTITTDAGTLTSPATQYKKGDKVAFSCVTGFYMSAPGNILTCRTDGGWATSGSECLRYCSSPNAPGNSVFSPPLNSHNGLYKAGVVWTYICNSGYYLSGTPGAVTCKTDGYWEGSGAVCWRYCDRSTIPDNWEIESDAIGAIGFQYRNGNVVTVTCTRNFRNWYTVPTITFVIRCNTDGSWSDIGFSCPV